MMADFILRHFAGFALQLIPAALLLFLPFDRANLRISTRWLFPSFTVVILGLCAVYTLVISIIHIRGLDAGGEGYLFGNLYMCGSIMAVMLLFFLLIRDDPMRKSFVFFSVVTFAAIQYCLVNVFLSFTPRLPASQMGQSYDTNTFFAYLIITAILLPVVAAFFRRTLRTYLKTMHSAYRKREFLLLIAVTVLYLVLNALLSMLWIRFQENTLVNQSLYMPVILLLTAMLFIVYYSVIKLSTLRAADAERDLEAAVIRMDHDRICSDMEKQRERLHDTRQLFRTLYMIARSGNLEELESYYDETVEHIHISDESYCWDKSMNGILQYYSSLANLSDVLLKIKAGCTDLSGISEADLTVLMGNALENAIHASKAYHMLRPDEPADISLIAEQEQNMLRIQIENPCGQVSFSSNVKNTGGFLPASAFLSTSGGGNGLRRIASIAEKYDGQATFRFDAETQRFIARIVLMIKDNL